MQQRITKYLLDPDPERQLDQLEAYAGRATFIILIGILLEIALLPWCEGSSWPKLWFPLIANALIGLGLAAEIWISRQTIIASGKDRENTNRKLANALERAAKAEEELARYRRSRREVMTHQNRQKLVSSLKGFQGQIFDTGVGVGGEQIHFLWDLEKVLTDAGWTQIDWASPGSNFCFHRNLRPVAGAVSADDVEIQIHPSHKSQFIKVAQAMVDALQEVGIFAEITEYLFENLNQNALHILIGAKR